METGNHNSPGFSEIAVVLLGVLAANGHAPRPAFRLEGTPTARVVTSTGMETLLQTTNSFATGCSAVDAEIANLISVSTSMVRDMAAVLPVDAEDEERVFNLMKPFRSGSHIQSLARAAKV